MVTTTRTPFALAAGIAAGALLSLGAASVSAQDIVVGGKNFTEQQILTSMTAQYLDAHGYDVESNAGMGSAVCGRRRKTVRSISIGNIPAHRSSITMT